MKMEIVVSYLLPLKDSVGQQSSTYNSSH